MVIGDESRPSSIPTRSSCGVSCRNDPSRVTDTCIVQRPGSLFRDKSKNPRLGALCKHCTPRFLIYERPENKSSPIRGGKYEGRGGHEFESCSKVLGAAGIATLLNI